MFTADDPQQTNGYTYASQNPATNADPNGTCTQRLDDASGPCVTNTGAVRAYTGQPQPKGEPGSKSTPPPATINPKTGLCDSNCAAIHGAVDKWYADHGCNGSSGSVFHNACWSGRDDIERMIIGAAWQQQRKNVANAPLFPNQMPDMLPQELAKAKALGVKPAQPGTPEFDAAIQSGTVKWAILDDGTLVVVPKFVNGSEISHAVLSGGRSVAAAGEADIAGSTSSGYYGLDVNNHSGHFLPSPESLQIGKNAFGMFGIEF